MERCFESITGEQIKLFKISGKAVRIDSKLIGSNIAQYSRFVLIHRTLCKVLKHPGIIDILSPKLRKQSAEYLNEDASKFVYRSTQEVINTRLVRIGMYIYEVLKRLKDDEPLYNLLHRVFHEQYIAEKGKVIPP